MAQSLRSVSTILLALPFVALAASPSTSCPDLRDAFTQLQSKYEELQARYQETTGVYAPAPVAVWLNAPGCKELGARYESLRKSYGTLSASLSAHDSAADVRADEAGKDRTKRADVIRRERRAHVTALREEGQQTLSEIDAFLGADPAHDPQARLDRAIEHLGAMRNFLRGFFDAPPPDLPAPSADLQMPALGSMASCCPCDDR